MSAYEKWRKLLCREPLEQRAWPVFARGLRDLLIRLAEDDGYLVPGPDELIVALQPHEEERLLIGSIVGLLLEDEFIVMREGGLYVRNLPKVQFGTESPELPVEYGDENVEESPQERRRRKARERKQRSRTKRDMGVTESVTSSVTERDMSRSPSPPLPLSLSDRERNREKVSESARVTERDTERDVSRVTERDSLTHSHDRDVSDSESATPIPLGLVDRAQDIGVLDELSKALRASPASVRASAEEFAAYWMIGAGAGRKRPHWMAKLREHVRRSAERGQLPQVADQEAAERAKRNREAFNARVEAKRKAHHEAAHRARLAEGLGEPEQSMAAVLAIVNGGKR